MSSPHNSSFVENDFRRCSLASEDALRERGAEIKNLAYHNASILVPNGSVGERARSHHRQCAAIVALRVLANRGGRLIARLAPVSVLTWVDVEPLRGRIRAERMFVVDRTADALDAAG
nr:hypothetical protein [Burkholderia ambifaria]